MRKSPVKLKCGSGQKCGSFRGGGEGGGGGGRGGTATFASFVNSARQLTPRQLMFVMRKCLVDSVQ